MAITKEIMIDGIKVKFKASASIPRLYRLKFGRDIYHEFSEMKSITSDSDISVETLEHFEDLAWLMAKHADPENVENSPDIWLEKFNTLSIYQVLPQILELWGLNLQTKVESKKNVEKLTEK
jgi:hypothetical protein